MEEMKNSTLSFLVSLSLRPSAYLSSSPPTLPPSFIYLCRVSLYIYSTYQPRATLLDGNVPFLKTRMTHPESLERS